MKKIIIIFSFFILISCTDIEDKTKALQSFQKGCKVKVSAKFSIGSWNNYFELSCDDIKEIK